MFGALWNLRGAWAAGMLWCLAGAVEGAEQTVSRPPAAASAGAAANPALRNDEAHLASPSMLALPASGPSVAEARAGMYREQLHLAQRLRQTKNYKLAEEKLNGVLEGRAPAEIEQSALIELALMAQEQEHFARAQQIFAQFIQRYPDHPDVPELLLRQGLLYRQMGAPTLGLSKFYGVMNAALHVSGDNMPRHRRLVLQAQTEIAETFYIQGDFPRAAEFFRRLLKLNDPDLNVAQVEARLIFCLAKMDQHEETIFRGREFLQRHPAFADVSEVRFQLAQALKARGKSTEALAQLGELLNYQRAQAEHDPARWRFWQQRVGNEVANQLYQQGDYLHALELYQTLSGLDESPLWQLPVWYQMALSYERLEQPDKALEIYQRIGERAGELKDDAPPSLRSVLDMARWRVDFIHWHRKASAHLPSPTAPARPAAAPTGHERPSTSG